MIEHELTKNQKMVFGKLNEASAPLSAYGLLDRLRDEGLRAPLQIYRALEKLVEKGLVHKLESLNAFVACKHECCETSTAAIFAICENCGKVAEFTDAKLARHVKAWARSDGFQLNKTTIELRGECNACNLAK